MLKFSLFFFCLQGFVKIARWNDINFWSVKLAVEKSHKTLHKFSKKFEVNSLKKHFYFIENIHPNLSLFLYLCIYHKDNIFFPNSKFALFNFPLHQTKLKEPAKCVFTDTKLAEKEEISAEDSLGIRPTAYDEFLTPDDYKVRFKAQDGIGINSILCTTLNVYHSRFT